MMGTNESSPVGCVRFVKPDKERERERDRQIEREKGCVSGLFWLCVNVATIAKNGPARLDVARFATYS